MHRKGGTDDGLAAAFFCTASTTASGVRIVELSEDCAKSERDIADRSAQDGRVGAVIMASQRQWCRTERGAILRRMRSNDGCWSAPWGDRKQRGRGVGAGAGAGACKDFTKSTTVCFPEGWRLPTLSQDRGETYDVAVRPVDASTPRQQPIRAVERAPGRPSRAAGGRLRRRPGSRESGHVRHGADAPIPAGTRTTIVGADDASGSTAGRTGPRHRHRK